MRCDGWHDDIFGESYRSWLSNTMDPRGEYTILFDYLHDVKFEWMLDRDEGRASDGCRLRERFAWEADIPLPEGVLDWPWFWMLMENIDLDNCDDTWMHALGPLAERNVSDKVDYVMYRKYGYSGEGGLFPLKHPRRDQRDTEIWMQLNEYCEETLL